MYSKNKLIAALLGSILILVVPFPLEATASWTVMVYLDGDNDLEPAAVDDFNEMEAIGSSAKVDIVVQFDRHSAYDNSNGDWTGTKRFYVTKDVNGYDTTISSSMISDLGEINMGAPSSLVDFVTWAKDNYPADHYLLVLWDHGSGWKTATDPVKSVCVDETDSDHLTVEEVTSALKSVTCNGDCPLDIVGFDACFMAMLEVDYDIMPYAHYRVGSEEFEPGDGWDYLKFLNLLVNNPYASPETVAKMIVDSYMNFYGYAGLETQSSVHLNPTGTVVESLDVFALHLAGAMAYATEIQAARNKVEFFSDLDYIDLYDFADLIQANVPHRGIKKDASILMKAVSNAVRAEGHGFMNRNAHGISIYYPSTSTGYQSDYENAVQLSENTFWDEFLKQYYNPSYMLSAVIVAEPDVAYSGELVTVSMEVTNNGDNTVTSVSPSPLTVASAGTAFAKLESGPVPVSADLVAGQSALFLWTYQVFSGPAGGALTFSGNAYGTDSVTMETVFSPLATSNAVTIPGPGQPTNDVPDYNEQMQPVADTRLQTAENILESLLQQAAEAESEGKDITPCEELLEQVDIYLERARENYERGNYIAANYWALQATAAMEEAEECLKNL